MCFKSMHGNIATNIFVQKLITKKQKEPNKKRTAVYHGSVHCQTAKVLISFPYCYYNFH